MSDTPNIGFPLLEQAQAQKEVTVNETLVILDVLMGGVISRAETAPPGSPSEGDAYIVAGTATGVWAGHEDDIAYYFGSVWNFLPPTVGEGHPVWDRNAGEFVQWDLASPSAWTPAVITGDASGITYTPADVTDWNGGADPGNTAPALDQLAGRVKDLELGIGGLSCFKFTIDRDSTADSDPGAGLIKFNNATPDSATFVYVDDSTTDSVDLSTYFGQLGQTGFLKIQSVADSGEWMIFKWTAVTDGTGYWKFAVSLMASKGVLDDTDAVLVTWDSDANTGTGGVELKGLTFTSDTGSTADSDPGNGLFKWNHATQASATVLYFDNQTLDAISLATYYAALPATGYLYLQQSDDSTKWQLWRWTAVTAGSGYYKFTVTLMASGGSIADDKTVFVDFKPDATGASGTTGKHAIWIAAGSITPSATGGCQALTTIASAANQPDIQTLDFDATTQEYVQFSIRMNKSWNEGTVTFVPEWSHAATTTNFGVVWDLQAYAASDDDAIAAAFGTAQTSTDTGGTTNDVYAGPESSAITIAGTPAAEDLVFFRLSRVTGNGSDTMAIDARLHGITLYITTDAENDA